MRARRVNITTGPPDVARRYKPLTGRRRGSAPLGLGAMAIFGLLGLVMLVVGANVLVGVVGQLAHAFDDAVSHVSSQAPATPPPSGVALDTPTLDAPARDGYTNVATISLTGAIPGAATGKEGYYIRVYSVSADGSRTKVAEIPVGDTTHFTTGAITLAEGTNTFVASLVTPASEGQPSPPVAYILDQTPPILTISAPADGSSQSGSSAVVSGKTDAGATVAIRNKQSSGGGQSTKVVGDDGRFSISIGLVAGSNTITVTSTDLAGNVATENLTVKRAFGKLSAHLTVSPSTFRGSGSTTITLTARATSANGGPLAGATATFTVTVVGLGPIVSPEIQTNQAGTATWKVTISGATAGVGAATVLVVTATGDQVPATAKIVTT